MALEALQEDRVERALRTLAATDIEAADKKVNVLRMKRKAESVEALVFAALQEGSVKDREARAKTDSRSEYAWEEYFSAVRENEICQNKRDHEARIVDLYRSVLSARKTGMHV